MLNATNLFEIPNRTYRSSESFWTSFLAFAILTGSRSSLPIKLPVFECVFEGDGGYFLQCDDLIINEPVELKNIVVEGRIQPNFLPNIKSVPNELMNLKPDILLRIDNSVIIIEVKTIGHSLGEYQMTCYDKLREFVRWHGYSAKVYYLLSAGHEDERDWKLLQKQSEKTTSANIILWEKLFQYLGSIEPRLAIFESLGDIHSFYENDYLSW